MTTANPLLKTPARPLPRHVAVIGAGTIGPDIGYYLASALPGLRLTLVDVAQAPLDKALARCRDYAAKAVARGKMSQAQAGAVTSAIVATQDYAALADCDWVIEAATENLALKRRIFAQLEGIVAAQCLVTSNTSSLPAARIFADMQRPGRATVTHFFAPAWRNPVVEVKFDREGKPASYGFVTNSGFADIDGPILDAIAGWRASGKPLEKLKNKDTIAVRIKLVLVQ